MSDTIAAIIDERLPKKHQSDPVDKKRRRMIMEEKLLILHLEDNQNDAALIYAALNQGDIQADVYRVQTRDEFEKALRHREFNLVISDFSLPSFDGNAALELTRSVRGDLPFIFVSGTIGENRAVESLLQGATDYVLKGHLSRLVPAVKRALQESNDAKERKQAEEALRKSEERFRNLVENINDVIFAIDLDQRLTFVSPVVKDVLGYQPTELVGTSIVRYLFKQDVPLVLQNLTRVLTGDLGSAEYRVVDKAGSVRWVRSSSRPVLVDGKVVGIQGVLTEVTKQKELEDQLLRAQRLESIGTLAGGIAHDLNNVLGPIMLCLEVMRARIKDEPLQKMIATIESSAKRGSDLIRQVLSFARGVKGEYMPIKIHHLLRETENIMRQTFPRSISVQMDLAKDAWTVLADATQLQQVFMNLCVNARDAMPDGGTIKMRLENVDLDEQFAGMQEGAKPGRYVGVSIKDTGTGMPAEVKSRIFEPFFTTKELGKGTGLGLSTSYSLVKSHGGFISVYSEMGRGTMFRVYLPAQDMSVTQEQEKDEAAPRGKGERILLVDDEEAVRTITQTTLEVFGYSVVAVSDGVDAVAKYAQMKAEIDLVITDMMMPYMDGPSTIKALRRISPSVKIIGVSGLEQESRNDIHVPMIYKPFSADKLLRIARLVLDS